MAIKNISPDDLEKLSKENKKEENFLPKENVVKNQQQIFQSQESE